MDRLKKFWFSMSVLFSFSLVLTVAVGILFAPIEVAGVQSSKLFSLPISQVEVEHSAIPPLLNGNLLVETPEPSSINVSHQTIASIFSWIDDLIRFFSKGDELSKARNVPKLIASILVVLLLTLISLPFIFLIWLWRLTQPRIVSSTLTIYRLIMGENTCYVYPGKMLIPAKVYEGDSHSLSIEIQTPSILEHFSTEKLHPMEDNNDLVLIQRLESENQEQLKQSLEILLLAGSGVTVEGERRQSHPLSSPKMTYAWICSFPTSSNQGISLTFNLLPPSEQKQDNDKMKNDVIELGYITRKVNVAKFGTFTKNQIWQLSIIVSLISTTLGLTGLKALPGFLKTVADLLKG
jgi:hypothetical protein